MIKKKPVMLVKLRGDTVIPKRGSDKAAGLDLTADLSDRPEFFQTTAGKYDAESNVVTIPPHSTCLIPTGVSIVMPDDHAGFVMARSGLSTKSALRPANCVGLIDEDYTGEIKVALHNDSDSVKKVHNGDRIAQLVIVPVLNPMVIQVNDEDFEFAHADKASSRGDGGFGSTGV